MKLTFGKYAGTEITEVPRGYLEWLIDSNRSTIAAAEAELKRRDVEDDGLAAPLVSSGEPHPSDARRLTVICDGACAPTNPGGYGLYAFVVYEGDVSGARGAQRPKLLASERACVGKGDGMTNNVAEYHAVMESLRWINKHAASSEVVLRSDSQLVVKHLNREQSCHADHLRKMYGTCLGLMSRLPKTHLVWVPREETYVADVLTRVAYEEARRAA